MSANWFDHAIASVAPRAAARRVLARQAFETLTRGYDGAAKGRRTEGWRAPGTSADTEVGVAGALLRDRMRDLVRNNPHAAKAVAVLVNNIVGAGIMPRAASGNDKLDRKVDALFAQWSDKAHADGQLDFYGLQTLICREMVEAGEVLVRRRLRRASDGLPVPLQVQVLEADFLDATKSGALGAGRLVQGIEFDAVGKRRAYWLHAEHPGDAYGALQNRLQSRPVPASEIAHVYEKQRTQARGVPWGAPVIRSLRDLDDYEVAELVRKKTEACVTAIVFGDDEAQQGIAPSVVDADGISRPATASTSTASRSNAASTSAPRPSTGADSTRTRARNPHTILNPDTRAVQSGRPSSFHEDHPNEKLRPARQHNHPDRALCRDLRRRPARGLDLRRGGRRCCEQRHRRGRAHRRLRPHQDRLAGLDRRRKGLLGRHEQALHHGRHRQHPHRRGRRGRGQRRGRHHRSGAPERDVLMSAFAAAVGALFADPNIGRDAVYIADGGAPVLVRAVARRADAVTDFGDARLWSQTTRVDLRVAEVANPRPGDRLEMDGEAFLIQGEPVRDRERLVWTLELHPK